MIKSYWCTLGNQQSVTGMVTAIVSEQADFLSSLGITVTATDTYNIAVTKSNAFYLVATGTGGISVYVPGSEGTNVVTSPTTTSYYLNLIFTANSLLITKNSRGTVPDTAMIAYACITKNSDNTVSVICLDGAGGAALIERSDYTSSSDVPHVSFTASSTGIDQFSFAAIPRAESGKQFDNAFFALAANLAVYSGLGTIGDTHFAICKETYHYFGCK